MPTRHQLTIRSIAPGLRSALEREARGRSQSLDETVVALLAERLGLASASDRAEFDDLDELAATWSEAEANHFDESIRAQRRVDKTLYR